MYLGNKRDNILFQLHGHSCLMALEDINILTTHAHQLFKNNSSKPRPPNSSMCPNIKENMLSKVVERPTIFTHKRIIIFFHFLIMQVDWKSLHIVDCAHLISIHYNKNGNKKCFFGNLQQNNMHHLCHPSTEWVSPILPINILNFKKLKSLFQTFIICHRTSMGKKMINNNKLNIIIFLLKVPHGT